MSTHRGSLTLVISTSDANERAGVLATFLIARHAELSIPVLVRLLDANPALRSSS